LRSAAPGRVIDRLFEVAIRLPWWGGLVSALAAYLLITPIAMLHMPTANGMPDVVVTALGQLLVLVARIAQYLLPLAFLVAAAVSGFDRWKRSELRGVVAQDTTGSALRGLRWTDFELLVGDAFRRRGFQVHAPRAGSRLGDRVLELSRHGRRFLVDCSDWRSWKAGAAAVRGLRDHMIEEGASGGFAVTSGRFTPQAKHFAADKEIELVDGRRLKELIRAEPQRGQANPALDVGALRSILARWMGLLQTLRQPSGGRSRGRKTEFSESPPTAPDFGAPTLRSSTEKRLAVAADAEETAGRQLAALIRAEGRIEEEVKVAAPPVQRRRAHLRPPRWRPPRIGARKIVDAIGILIAIGILWGIYGWFLELSDTPDRTPWALLGAHSDSESLVRRLQGLGQARSVAEILEGKRPLGQYRFGPPPGFLAETEPEIPQQEEEPVEIYHSLHELEAAFDAKYVPPPECYASDSNSLFVKCGNHRIRARREFIESGGKVTATLLGGWEEPRVVVTEIRPRNWSDYDQGDGHWDSTDEFRDLEEDSLHTGDREWQKDDEHDGQTGWERGWTESREPDPRRDWRRERTQRSARELDRSWGGEWLRQPAQDPTQSWRQDWSQGTEEDTSADWRSKPLPVERRHWVDDL
jgi:restriction system protein